jgi:CHAT domain-containing protein
MAPSLNYLASRTGTRAPDFAKKLLLIGDPASSTAQYPPLEFAAREIDSIAQTMPASKIDILRGAAATPKSYFQAQPAKFEYVHFAAHATANPLSPLDSAVILSGPAGQNRLFARQVMTVPLAAELVTISACRSAGGKAYAGEGLVGFAWAFLRAGAHNVVAGLWDVSDRSTAQLMTDFYRHISSGDPAPEALRASKIALIRSGGAYVKRFYWAPFQIYAGALDLF